MEKLISFLTILTFCVVPIHGMKPKKRKIEKTSTTQTPHKPLNNLSIDVVKDGVFAWLSLFDLLHSIRLIDKKHHALVDAHIQENSNKDFFRSFLIKVDAYLLGKDWHEFMKFLNKNKQSLILMFYSSCSSEFIHSLLAFFVNQDKADSVFGLDFSGCDVTQNALQLVFARCKKLRHLNVA